MPKKAPKEGHRATNKVLAQTPEAISETSDGRVLIKVLAKPGAKQNSVTDIQEEVGIQIAAPPVEGAANTELIRYLGSVLGVKRSQLTLEKGSKSRTKTVSVSNVTREGIVQALQAEVDNSK